MQHKVMRTGQDCGWGCDAYGFCAGEEAIAFSMSQALHIEEVVGAA